MVNLPVSSKVDALNDCPGGFGGGETHGQSFIYHLCVNYQFMGGKFSNLYFFVWLIGFKLKLYIFYYRINTLSQNSSFTNQNFTGHNVHMLF